MNSIVLEVCVDSIQSLRNTINGGAQRIELCSCLFKGGLTPSVGLFVASKDVAKNVPIFVMLRARPGDDFIFSKEEQQVMLNDLEVFKKLGADGFVYGALNEDATINIEFCEEIIKAASPLPVTFHRAFDNVSDDSKALETLIQLGFKRILTSGRENSVVTESARKRLKSYLDIASDRITILPGAGITVDNVNFVLETGVKEVHGSFKKLVKLPSLKNVNCGLTNESVDVTDEEHVRNVVEILNSYKCTSS